MAATPATQNADTRFGPLGLLLMLLVASNLFTNLVLPEWAYVPWNLTMTALVVLIATRLDGQRAATIGLARGRLLRGLALGGAISSVLALVMIIGVLLPATREIFMDERADVPFWQMAYKVFIEVPLGTVLVEEVAFRGVLPAMVSRRLVPGPRRRLVADALVAVLFGLWHILPSMSLGGSNDEIADQVDPLMLQIGGVVVSVLVTATVAMGLSWMRNRSDSVAAPYVLHTTSNSLGSALAWIAQRVL